VNHFGLVGGPAGADVPANNSIVVIGLCVTHRGSLIYWKILSTSCQPARLKVATFAEVLSIPFAIDAGDSCHTPFNARQLTNVSVATASIQPATRRLKEPSSKGTYHKQGEQPGLNRNRSWNEISVRPAAVVWNRVKRQSNEQEISSVLLGIRYRREGQRCRPVLGDATSTKCQ